MLKLLMQHAAWRMFQVGTCLPGVVISFFWLFSGEVKHAVHLIHLNLNSCLMPIRGLTNYRPFEGTTHDSLGLSWILFDCVNLVIFWSLSPCAFVQPCGPGLLRPRPGRHPRRRALRHRRLHHHRPGVLRRSSHRTAHLSLAQPPSTTMPSTPTATISHCPPEHTFGQPADLHLYWTNRQPTPTVPLPTPTQPHPVPVLPHPLTPQPPQPSQGLWTHMPPNNPQNLTPTPTPTPTPSYTPPHQGLPAGPLPFVQPGACAGILHQVPPQPTMPTTPPTSNVTPQQTQPARPKPAARKFAPEKHLHCDDH